MISAGGVTYEAFFSFTYVPDLAAKATEDQQDVSGTMVVDLGAAKYSIPITGTFDPELGSFCLTASGDVAEGLLSVQVLGTVSDQEIEDGVVSVGVGDETDPQTVTTYTSDSISNAGAGTTTSAASTAVSVVPNTSINSLLPGFTGVWMSSTCSEYSVSGEETPLSLDFYLAVVGGSWVEEWNTGLAAVGEYSLARCSPAQLVSEGDTSEEIVALYQYAILKRVSDGTYIRGALRLEDSSSSQWDSIELRFYQDESGTIEFSTVDEAKAATLLAYRFKAAQRQPEASLSSAGILAVAVEKDLWTEQDTGKTLSFSSDDGVTAFDFDGATYAVAQLYPPTNEIQYDADIMLIYNQILIARLTNGKYSMFRIKEKPTQLHLYTYQLSETDPSDQFDTLEEAAAERYKVATNRFPR